MRVLHTVLFSLCLLGPAAAQDDVRAKPLFDAEHPLRDILTSAMGHKKFMIVVVRGGPTYTARVKQVGAHAVVLTQLDGKEFFDAYVALDDIVALEERVRLR